MTTTPTTDTPSRLRAAKERAERATAPARDVDLAEYETVAERIKKFWTKNKNGRITTDLFNAEGPAGATRWIIRASVWRNVDNIDPSLPPAPDATGFATETDGLGDEITAYAALETAETSAIGRALANLGYDGKRRATREGVASTRAKAAAAKDAPTP